MVKRKGNVVYTVSSVDVETDNPVQTDTIGSWKRRSLAVSNCVGYILERISLRPDIRYALFHDVNHRGMFVEVKKRVPGASLRYLHRLFDFKMTEDWYMRPEIDRALRDIMLEALATESVYEIVTDMESAIGVETFIFEIAENPLKG